MAEIRCPMCSKMNPSERDVCQFCQARLKPLIGSQEPSPNPYPFGHEDDLPDWLKSLTPEPDQPSQDLPQAEEQTPEWLRRIREKSQNETHQEEDSPEWLRNIRGGEDAHPAGPGTGSLPGTPAVTGSLGGSLDWIDRLKTGHLNLHPSEAEPPFMPSGERAEEHSTEQAVEPGIPLKTGRGEEPGSFMETPPLETASEPSILEPSSTGLSEETPDWLKDFALLASEPPQAAPATSQEGDRETPSEMDGQVPAAATFDHLPEWLRNTEPEEAAPEGTPWTNLDEGQDSASNDLPDWLSSLTVDRPEGVEPTSEVTAPGIPSWGTPAPGEIPSWSDIASSFTNAGGSSKPVTGLEQSAAPSEPSPFAHFLAEQAQPQPSSETPSQPAPAEPAPPAFQADTPDWLAALEAHSTIQPVESSVPALSFDEPSPAKGDTTVEPFVLADLPDWLAGLGPVRTGGEPAAELIDEPADLRVDSASRFEAEGEAAEAEAEQLAPAELPSWIQALRPIQSVAPKALDTEVDQRVEKSGPLAGLRGALPAESMSGAAVKPPSFAVKLEATDTQKQYARIFDELIATETDPQPAQADQLISSQRIFRLVLAILLLLVVGYPTLTQTKLLPIPKLYSQEIILLRQAIDSLPENAPVLLAVDYELPLAGEMEPAASSVVDHLMSKGARLVTISTSPTGPVLAASLIERVTAQPAVHHAPYIDGSRWISLGYLAGGPAGLLNFSQTPMLAAPAFQAGGERAWAKPIMQGVTGLDDFAMVVVLTDSYDSGRIWLEQIQPQLGSSTPFLMVASAQAAPLLRPYLDGGQADGLVSGLAGAASYEQLRQRPGSGTASWDAFQAGMIGSIALILIGGIVYLILGTVKRPKTKREAAASEGAESHGNG